MKYKIRKVIFAIYNAIARNRKLDKFFSRFKTYNNIHDLQLRLWEDAV